jgi:hypothetical protein
MSLLDVLRQIAKTGIDFEMLPNGSGGFVLSAYKDGLGSNKSTTVFFRVGINCQEISSDEAGGDVRNALLVKYKNGYTVVSDSTSITNRRRREKAVNYEYAQSSASAATLAGAELTLKKDPRKQISVKITDGKGPRVFEDYVLGDTITLDNKGEEAQYRIRGIHLSWNGDEFADVIVDLNSMILENEIRITQDVDWLMEMWKTAHDANLLETSFWAAIGDRGITYGVRDMLIVGDLLYVGNYADSNSLLIYNLASGGWQRVDLGTSTHIPVALANIGNDIYIYSPFYLQKYSGSTLTTIADIEFVSNPSATVAYDIVAVGNKLYLAGNYSLIDGNAITGIAVYDTVAATWTDIGEGATALGTDGTNIYTGTKMWNGSTWTKLGTFPATFGIITSVVPYDAGILVGTNYTGGIYYWDGSAWSLFGGGVNGYVYDIAVYLTDVYIVGTFTDAGSRVAKYSGGEWWMLDTGINGTGYSILANDSDGNVDIYVGGPFTEAGGKPAQGIAAYFNNFEALANYLENTSGTFNLGEAIHGATAKTPMVSDDEIPLWDSITKQLRKITWANVLLSIATWADAKYVALTGTQTVAGVKTFSSSPIVPTPTTDYQASTKKYVDDNIGGGGGTPGGANGDVQYNNSGVMGGSDEFVIDPSGKVLYLGETTSSGGVPGQGFNFSPTASAGHVMNTWGTGLASFFKGVLARGTKASPTAVQSADVLVRYRGAGYDGVTGVGGAATNGEIRVVATENYDATHHGADVEIHATPAASTTLMKILSVLGSGHVNIAPSKQYQVNGSQHTHDAADVTAGTMATARLGSGTASSAKRLAGDSSWVSNTAFGFYAHLLSGQIPASSTRYTAPFFVNVIDPAERTVPILRAGVVKNLYVRVVGTVAAQPASGSLVVSVRLNATTDVISITVPANTNTTYNAKEIATSVSVVAGDIIGLKFVNNATGASVPIGFVAFEFEAT